MKLFLTNYGDHSVGIGDYTTIVEISGVNTKEFFEENDREEWRKKFGEFFGFMILDVNLIQFDDECGACDMPSIVDDKCVNPNCICNAPDDYYSADAQSYFG